MPEYAARYPAVEAVRTNLGEKIWAHLESYRSVLVNVAFLTGLWASPVLKRPTPTINEVPKLKAILDKYIPDMETYIRDRWGAEHLDLFQSLPISVEARWPMKYIRKLFRRQPLFFLIYSLSCPLESRMTWSQVSLWAISALQEPVPEDPVWPIRLRGVDVWNSTARGLWNRAEVELHEDIRRRFSSIHLWAS